MCGIAGIVHFEGAVSQSEAKLDRMVGKLFHRGPDECGFYFDDQVSLGMARLSIIDLQHGSQPIANENETIWVVFNGEIFNYQELRTELEKQGHTFRTASDTEVIVHSYEEWGKDFVSNLNGQFAIGLWDQNKRQFLLARDRLGIRPLFYAQVNNRLLFASEIKSILAEGTLPAQPDVNGLKQIFTFWVNVPPRTVFKDIFELPPGNILIVKPSGLMEQTYWDIPFLNSDTVRTNQQTLQEELYALLLDAVKIRLRADVPVGAYLSGGLDSSIITALVNNIHQNRLKTFSVNFSNQSYDERFFQKLLIEQLQTEHRSLTVNDEDILHHFFETIKLTEKPILRTAPAPLLALSSLVRSDDFKVVLTGEGADEFFAGYNIFKETKVRQFWAQAPHSASRPLLLSKIYPYILNQNGALNPFWQAFFKRHLTETQNPFYSHLLRWENTAKIHLLLSDALKSQFHFEDQLDEVKAYLPALENLNSPLTRAQYIEAKLFMNGYLLSSQGDRMLMGHSVEGRFPFLDHRVVEFAATLPDAVKLFGLQEKYILKKTFKDILPPAIAKRPKQPYRAPISGKLLENSRFDWLQELLSPTQIDKYGYFSAQRVQVLKTKLMQQSAPTSLVDEMAFLAILSTQLWHYHFFENFSAHSGRLATKKKIVYGKKENRSHHGIHKRSIKN